MTLLKASRRLSMSLLACALTLTGAALSSCDSLIYDDQGDCSVHYNVSFIYPRDEGFSYHVKSVTLFLVNEGGDVVLTKSESGEALSKPDYTMDMDVAPGTYDIIVWGEGEAAMADHTAFEIGRGSVLQSLTATLPLSGVEGDLYSDKDIRPLFHGMLKSANFPDSYGDIEIGQVELVKDTNVFQILLQSYDGSEIDSADFSFSIEADNSQLAYDNAITSTTPFSYRPWQVTPVMADFEDTSRADDIINGIFAELTTGRLMPGRRPLLVIRRNSDGVDVLRIDLIKYLLMVKGEYNRLLSDQEYLDRLSVFSLVFFLDSDRNWYTAGGIYINGWRVVPPQQEVVG